MRAAESALLLVSERLCAEPRGIDFWRQFLLSAEKAGNALKGSPRNEAPAQLSAATGLLPYSDRGAQCALAAESALLLLRASDLARNLAGDFLRAVIL